jgi:hypothetical protein
MQFTYYKSDSGSRDMPEKRYSRDHTLEEMLIIANEKGARILSKTSYISDAKPGAWYIKGSRTDTDYDVVKAQIETNVAENKHTRRQCWLLR